MNDWETRDVGGVPRLHREFKFKDFASALEFTNRIGVLAEEHGHHPLLVTEWGRVTVEWWTHSKGGIDARDRDMAAATDRLYGE